MRRLSSSLSLSILLLLTVTLIGAVSFVNNPSWYYSSDGPYTNDSITCSWNFSADTTAQNITILRNNIIFSSVYESGSLSNNLTITPDQTTKNDNWTCRIILSNATDNITQQISVRIKNSPPTTEGTGAGIFYLGNDIGYVFDVQEDTSYNIDVNATDADADTITYLSGEEFCTRTSSSQGLYTCIPNSTYIVNNNLTYINISFTATDGQNPSGRTVVFNITPVNDKPVAVLSNKNTAVNASLNMTFSATDEELNYPLHFTLQAPLEVADVLSVVPLNGQGTSFSVYYDATVIDYANIGLWNITVNVTDTSTNYLGQNDSLTGSYSFLLNVTPVGRRPYFTNVSTNITGWPVGMINLAQGQSVLMNFSANDLDLNSTLYFISNTSYFSITTYKNDTNDSTDVLGSGIFTPTNDQVGIFNVSVIVSDLAFTNSTLLRFNVSNVNDAPIIYTMSYVASNKPSGNNNISNLVAYANTPFKYVVNATDLDIIHGDHITYSDNTSLFVIDANTGIISFTPTDGEVSVTAYDILITAQDNMSVQDTKVLRLTIGANTAPYFNATIPRLTCGTKTVCSYDLSLISTDVEDINVSSYGISFVGTNLSNFSFDNITGIIDFTVPKTAIGNYTANITITDSLGAYNWSLMNITIYNIPELPIIKKYNITDQSTNVQTVVETHTVIYELTAEDDDLLVAALNETVVFKTNLTGKYSHLNATITALPSINNTARALFTYTPASGDNGTYTIYINATDSYGGVDTKILVFDILSKVGPPNITQITPWGLSPLYALNTTYALTNETQFLDGIADVNFDENTTVVFGAEVVDLAVNIASYEWTVNGTSVGSNITNFTKSFDLFSSGRYIVRLNVTNDRYEKSSFAWNISVRNINRLPVLLQNLSSLSLNRSRDIGGYFDGFLDPDDDLNTNGILDGAEVNHLQFSTIDSCPQVSLGFNSANLSVDINEIGTCYFTFNATDLDGGKTVSNTVMINVTDVPGTTVVPQSGGGGGSSTPTVVPIRKKVETPKAFNLIAPKLVTIYTNRTIEIPITINNTWNAPLKMLRLRAESNTTGVNITFDANMFEEIPVNQSREVKIFVSNYRMGDNYEIKVIGNTSSPSYEDSALILLNSIESTTDGDEAKIKVTFANDLVNEHPECQELNEVLAQAKVKIADGNLAEGMQLVDGVINGCKYLVSVQQNIQEKPSKLNPIINIDELSAKTIMLGLLAFIVIISIVFVVFYHYTHKVEDDI